MRPRFRTLYMVGGSLLLILALVATDPDSPLLRSLPIGGPALAWLLAAARGVLVVALAHMAWRALHDYPEADGQELYSPVHQGNTAAGLALLSRALIVGVLLFVFSNTATSAIPPQALQHLPTLAAAVDKHWPEVPMRHYPAGLVEHESCISLTHSRCWSPTSRLRTAREEGAGLGQLTRAFRADGSLRFDALAEMRARHPALRDLSWANVYQRPDLQLAALVLKVRGDFDALRAVREPMERLAMADAAYNGGLGGVHQERRACGLRAGCDPQRWWGHVERTCLKSAQPLYGTRSACDINRHHVADVLLTRAPKYAGRL
jgi:hypothetical protein